MNAMRKTQTYLYKKIFSLIKVLTKEDIEVWYRNSLYFNNLSSYRSDIDLTVIGSSHQQILRTINRIQFLKKLIPIIGEVNSYKEDMLSKVLLFANYYELGRDPILLGKATEEIEPSFAQKKVFLSRMTLSNEGNIKKGFFDQKKWKFYFSRIREETPSNFEDIFNYLNIRSVEDLKSSLVYNPVEHLAQALHDNKLEELLERITNLSGPEKEILIENLRWEISGVSSQIYIIRNNENIIQHFENINKILKALESPLTKDLEALIFDIAAIGPIY